MRDHGGTTTASALDQMGSPSASLPTSERSPIHLETLETRAAAKPERPPSSWLKTLTIGAGAILAVSAVFWLSASVIGLDENGILSRTLSSFAGSNWALPIVALAFAAASLIGAPQFLLIAVTVAVFGPLLGFFYSVAATLVSASFNFHLARQVGADWLRKRGWAGADRAMDLVGRNGFLASLIVRIVPSAPFIVVNMGLGLTKTPYATFLAGTAIGILPKTAVIALLGKVVERAQAGELTAIGYLCLAAGTWLTLAFLGKWALHRREAQRKAA